VSRTCGRAVLKKVQLNVAEFHRVLCGDVGGMLDSNSCL